MPPLFLAGCSYLFPSKEDKRFTPKDLNLPEIKYHAEMEVLGDKSEESYFKSVPELMHSDASAPTSTNALRYRAEADLKLLRKALKNRGYFNGKVDYILDYSQEEKHIKFIVTPGELYHIEGVDIEMTGADDIPIMPAKARKVINITNGEQVRLDKVINSVILLNRYFVTHGYPDAKVEEPLGRINDAKRTVLLIYKIDLNGKKRYGKLTIAGNQSVSTCYIKNRLPIKEGEFYDQQELDNARRSLLDSEIFSTVIITHESQGDRANLKVDVKEAPPRRVAAGLRYGTQEGIGGKLLWQHKNVFGNGEDFYIRGEGGQRQMKASIGLRIPDVIWRDFTLSTTASLTKANTKAYDGYVYNYYVGLEHKVDAYSTYSVGAEAELSDLKKFRRVKRYFGGLPMSYIYDASNDRINPYKGWRLRLDFAPYLGDFVQNRPMFRLHLMSSQYWRLVKKDKFVIATWERIGQIEGIPFTDIPLNRLWYGGGSGSVRGYAFQKLSKPDPNGSPMGGKSIIEFGIEPRWRVTETIGLSLFWEAGAVSEKRIAGLKSQEYRSGYGIGAKYYTDIGPLRIDLAFPSKRRKINGKSYDSAVQFYISLGQAF
ncbi:autotransporter assembly complex protein TamA [Candidatus Odyssella thessalonicensis]|uniref:autotransporter assembly complex protein TamA n=1 Tax=Candidatus Odyssella thessalonicensis TaxID=84647 RepID=UPI000225B17C|nr:BamA/TamA family outer membrane protein [Candidatus Odyssella thessalonicensis]